MDCQWLHHLLSIYLSLTIAMSKSFIFFLSYLKRFPFLVTIVDALLSIFYRFHGLSPCTVDLDDQTTMHYWTPTHRRFNKPSLVLVHGYGSTTKWQFYSQVGQLSRTFNLYLPELLFFGDSYTNRDDRTEVFQARCVCEGLKRLGVERFSLYAISYGGWVGYRMAEMYPEMVEKVVIVSSGVGLTEEQKEEHLSKVGVDVRDLFCPEKPEHLRSLMNLTMHKSKMAKWLPDFFLNEYIRIDLVRLFLVENDVGNIGGRDMGQVMCKKYRKERIELVEYLIAKKADSQLPILSQETLLIWGDQDKVFPPYLAYQLQRHLGPKSKVEIIKGIGHAANIEAADDLNDLTESFVLSSPKFIS